MARNTTVNLVSEKGRKLTAEEHDETIGNLKETADEAFNNAETLQSEMSEGFDFLFDNKLDKLERAVDSALLQGKGIGTNQGDVMAVGAFGVGGNIVYVDTGSVLDISKTGFYLCSSNTTDLPVEAEWAYVNVQYLSGSRKVLLATTYTSRRMFYRVCVGGSWGYWIELATTSTSQTLTNKKISFQNTNDAAANVLDWYEEGSFTPGIYGSNSSGSGTYSAQSGFYQRIGNRVHFQLHIAWSAHTGTGSIRVNGLPFAPNNIVSVPCNFLAQNIAFAGTIKGAVEATLPVIVVYTEQSGGNWNEVLMSGVGELRISGSYRV